jgi:hypothetical protein
VAIAEPAAGHMALLAPGSVRWAPLPGPAAAIAFEPNAHKVAMVDRDNDRVWLASLDSRYVEWQLAANREAGVANPIAAEFTADGRQLLVANASPPGVLVVGRDMAHGLRCWRPPDRLFRLQGSVFALTGFSNGTVMLLDGSKAEPRVLFVPSSPVEDQR